MITGTDRRHLAAEIHIGGHAERNIDKQMRLAVAFRPADGNVALHGINHGVRGFQLRRNVRLDADFVVSRSRRNDAGDVCVEEISRRAVHRMIVGIHAGILLEFEAFPDRRRLMLDHVAEGRIGFVRHQLPCVVDIAVSRKHIEQIACAEVARREAEIPFAQIAAHDCGGFLFVIAGNKTEPERKRLRPLRTVSDRRRFGMPPLRKERLADLDRKIDVLERVIGTMEVTRHLGKSLAVGADMTVGKNLTLSTKNAKISVPEGTITAQAVYNAVWNDYAEFFERAEYTEVGDIIALTPKDGKEAYGRATQESKGHIVGIHSDSFGHLIGGEKPENGMDFVEFNLPKFIPVGLIGRVKTKIVGPVKTGDFIVLDENLPGTGRVFTEKDNRADIIGFAVEGNDAEEVKLVRVKLSI